MQTEDDVQWKVIEGCHCAHCGINRAHALAQLGLSKVSPSKRRARIRRWKPSSSSRSRSSR